MVVVAALTLSACGGAETTESPTDVPAAQPVSTAAPAAAPAQPTPTFERISDAEPTIAAAPQTNPAAVGALAWRDQVLRNDAVIVSVTGLAAPRAGQTYAAWLTGKDGSTPLGPLSIGGDPATLTFVSPTNANLLGAFNQIYITQAPQASADTQIQRVIMSGTLPEKALVHIRHVLFSIGNTPGKIGFALGLRQETDELLRHAQFLKDAFDAGDFRLVKVHAEHINNIIKGAEAGDLNGDGKLQNPGDGFGLLPNGTQDGYIKGMVDHAKLAAEAPDATSAIKLHAGHVQIAGENTRVRVQDILDRAVKISGSAGIADTQQDVLRILALTQQAIQGIDVNQDEQIGPVPGEGGVLTAYQHAQLMAGIALAPSDGTLPLNQAQATAAPAPTQAAPAPAVQTITIDIGDNTFAPSKTTVPVGATVVWKHTGKKPHTVTADTGAFDSGKLDNGSTFAFTFKQAGTFPYFCQFHGGKGGEGMAGTIIVADQSAVAPPPAPQPTTAPPQPTAAPQQAGPAPAADVPVAIGDNSFTPKELSVPVGATVVWTNQGQRKHTVTGDDGWINSGTLEAGATFKQTFDKPGTYAYYCEFHGGPGGAGMAAVIKVGDAAAAPQPPQAPTPAPQPTAAPQAAPPAPAPATLAISMRDFEFGPKELTIKTGTTVIWKNDGAKKHSATAADGSFDTGLFGTGESKSVTFDKPGTFAYYCQLHGTPDGNGMVGTLVVQ